MGLTIGLATADNFIDVSTVQVVIEEEVLEYFAVLNEFEYVQKLSSYDRYANTIIDINTVSTLEEELDRLVFLAKSKRIPAPPLYVVHDSLVDKGEQEVGEEFGWAGLEVLFGEMLVLAKLRKELISIGD